MYARLATFESDPANLDEAIAMVRGEVESEQTPPGLEGAKMLMLVNRETGKGIGITLFESQEAMRRGDEALNAMNPGAGEQRTSVEFFEVPVQTVSLVGSSIERAKRRDTRPSDHDLEIKDRRAVDRLQRVRPGAGTPFRSITVTGVQADRVRPVGRAGGEHAGQRQASVAAWGARSGSSGRPGAARSVPRSRLPVRYRPAPPRRRGRCRSRQGEHPCAGVERPRASGSASPPPRSVPRCRRRHDPSRTLTLLNRAGGTCCSKQQAPPPPMISPWPCAPHR